jgi:hypothetical protein
MPVIVNVATHVGAAFDNDYGNIVVFDKSGNSCAGQP